MQRRNTTQEHKSFKGKTMATNKWQSQCIKRKFKNKHKKIPYKQTRQRNKRSNRRKSRRLNAFLCKQDLLDIGILNIKPMKGSKRQYSDKKTYKPLHPDSPQLHPLQSLPQLNFAISFQVFHSPSYNWLCFRHFGYDSHRMVGRSAIYRYYNQYNQSTELKYHIAFNNRNLMSQYWPWWHYSRREKYAPQERYLHDIEDNVYIDMMLFKEEDKEMVIQCIETDKHFGDYYVKYHRGYIYIFICYLSKYHRSPKRKLIKKGPHFNQQLLSLQGYSMIDFNKIMFRDICIESLKKFIDTDIVYKHHFGILEEVGKYHEEYMRKFHPKPKEPEIKPENEPEITQITVTQSGNNQYPLDPNNLAKIFESSEDEDSSSTESENEYSSSSYEGLIDVSESLQSVQIVVTMILDAVDETDDTQHIFEEIWLKSRRYKLKNATIKVNCIGSNIVDLYQVDASKDSNIEIPIKSVTDLEKFNKYCRYTMGANVKRYLNEQPALIVAAECVKQVTELMGDSNGDSNFNGKKDGVVINKCHETECNVLPVPFDFEGLLYEYIPSGDIIENILIPYVGYKKFYHCADDLFISDCHRPYFNLLPLSSQYSRILYDYIPANDILFNVLIPFIGYDSFYYVVIDNGVGDMGKYKQGYDIYNIYDGERVDDVMHVKSSMNRPEIGDDNEQDRNDGGLEIGDFKCWWMKWKKKYVDDYDDTDPTNTSSRGYRNLFPDDTSSDESSSSW